MTNVIHPLKGENLIEENNRERNENAKIQKLHYRQQVGHLLHPIHQSLQTQVVTEVTIGEGVADGRVYSVAIVLSIMRCKSV